MNNATLDDFLYDLDTNYKQEDNSFVNEDVATSSDRPASSQSGLSFDDVPTPKGNRSMNAQAQAQSISDFQQPAEKQQEAKPKKRKISNHKFELLNFDFSKDNPSVELTVKSRANSDSDFREVTKKPTDFQTIAKDLGGKAVAAIFYAGLNAIGKQATKGMNPDQMLPSLGKELDKLKQGDFSILVGTPRTAGGKPKQPLEVRAVAKALGISIAKATELWTQVWSEGQRQAALTSPTTKTGAPNPIPNMLKSMQAQEAQAENDTALEDFF